MLAINYSEIKLELKNIEKRIRHRIAYSLFGNDYNGDISISEYHYYLGALEGLKRSRDYILKENLYTEGTCENIDDFIKSVKEYIEIVNNKYTNKINEAKNNTKTKESIYYTNVGYIDQYNEVMESFIEEIEKKIKEINKESK